MEILLKEEINGKTLSIQAGKVARQASGSVVVQYGDTIVLVTAVSDTKEKASSFLPLSVEYQEKIYAAGRIPGNYFRREIGRPSEKETLTARLIDRPIRPLFPKQYRFETQVIATVLSMDQENDPDTLAMLGASAALTISDIPFAGPIASVRVGRPAAGQSAHQPVGKKRHQYYRGRYQNRRGDGGGQRRSGQRSRNDGRHLFRARGPAAAH